MEKIKIKIGQNVVVPFVRSNHLDSENGIGWTCQNAIVEVSKINDLTFCFEFNGENHFELISEATPSRSSQSNLFGESSNIVYAKNSLDYRLKVEYGVS